MMMMTLYMPETAMTLFSNIRISVLFKVHYMWVHSCMHVSLQAGTEERKKLGVLINSDQCKTGHENRTCLSVLHQKHRHCLL